jgi:hypothetical protein
VCNVIEPVFLKDTVISDHYIHIIKEKKFSRSSKVRVSVSRRTGPSCIQQIIVGVSDWTVS